MSRRRLHAALGGLAALALSMAAGPVATATAGPPPSASFRVDDNLERALGVHDRLPSQAAVAATPAATMDRNEGHGRAVLTALGVSDTPAASGYAGSVTDPTTGEVTVWWNGPMPANERAAMAAADKGSGKVTVHDDAPYSRYELASRILANRDALAGSVLSIPREDGAGIVVIVPPGDGFDKAAAAAALDVPVTYVEDDLDLVNGPRQNSSSPWWGGAMMISSGGNVCSTGFAVLSGVEGRLLSAAHCDTSGNVRWNNGNLSNPTRLTPGGSAVSVILSMDSMLINPDNGTRGRVHTGGIYSDGTQWKGVSGTATNNVGQSVATGGANSGQHRGLVIFDDAYSNSCNGYSCTGIGARNSGTLVVVGGDSGGPVYHTNSDGTLTAKGIIKGAPKSRHVSCTSSDYRFDPGTETWDGSTHRRCYDTVVYMPIRPLLNAWNVVIEKN